MKEGPESKRQRAILDSSRISAEGFLGHDARSIEEIIQNDTQALLQSGISPKEGAMVLSRLYSKAKAAFGNKLLVFQNRFEICHFEAMGRIPSPFPEHLTFEKGEIKIKDIIEHHKARVTPLSIHLIRKYGFLQGKGARYRMDPHFLAALVRSSRKAANNKGES